MKTIILFCLSLLIASGMACSGKKKLPATYIVDDAGILTEQQENKLNALCAELESRTGSQIVVNCIDSLNGEIIEAYAHQAFNTWGIGRKEINDGVLIVVALAERKTRIEVGDGLETIVTDSLAAGIVDQKMLPRFREGSYYQGLLDAIQKMKDLIESHREQIGMRQLPPPVLDVPEKVIPPTP